MLSGYTAAIIGVPAALAPLTAFDLAWARCLEITLGIGCATLASQIVFPRTVGNVLQATIDAAWSDARQWTVDVLREQADAANGLTDRRKLVADIVRLETLRAHAVFDTPEHPGRRKGGPSPAGPADDADVGAGWSSRSAGHPERREAGDSGGPASAARPRGHAGHARLADRGLDGGG